MRALVLVVLAALVWPASADAQRRRGSVVSVVHEAPATIPTLGPRFAPVTIELFMVSARSTRSSRLYRHLMALQERHPTRLRLVFRFPFADTFSNAARVAYRQGHFRKVMDAIYNGRFRRQNEIKKIISELGLDWPRFERGLKAGYHAEKAARDRYYGRRWGLSQLQSSRPGMLVNARPDSGEHRSLESLERLYDDAYGRARRLLSKGVTPARLYAVLRAEHLNQKQPLEAAIGGLDGDEATDSERENHPGPVGLIDYRVAHPRGPATAKVTLAWFCSLQSPHCSRLYKALEDVRKTFPDDLRVSFFHAYRFADKQPGARRLHLAALCAEDQGDLWGFVDRIYARTPSGEIKDEFLEQVALSLQLDGDQLVACTGSKKTAQRLQKALLAAKRARITRTPTVVIGGLAYLGSRDYFQLARLVEGQLRAGLMGRLLWPNVQ